MNELDDLKSIWKQQGNLGNKDEADIARMLQGRSQSIVSKLKRSVWFELIFTIAVGIAMAVYGLTTKSGAMAWMVLTLSVIFVVYLFYYVKKIILLNRYTLHSANVKHNLQQLADRLTAYLQFYKRSYAILYPAYFLLGLFFGAMESGMDAFVEKFTHWKTLAWFCVFTLVFMAGLYQITNWYLKKLYGNHLTKLKDLLNELEN
jgi:hypothetical protein